MILTCPKCASRYFVDDARIGSNGRTVRCAGCGNAWKALPDSGEADLPLALTPDVTAPTPAFELGASGEAERAAPLPKRLRDEALEKRRTREAIAAGAIWAGMGAGFIAIVLGAVLFRIDVVRLWPQAAGAYAFARMPVNPTGLSIERVQGLTNLVGGHAALTITGEEHNIEVAVRRSMPLRVILLDKAGKRLGSMASAPPPTMIAAGESKPFSINFIDPPADVSSVDVEFAFDKVTPVATPESAPSRHGAGKALAASEPAAMKSPRFEAPPAMPAASVGLAMAPLEAREARPLPANSPYALPPAASDQASH